MSQWLNEQRGERATIDTFPQAVEVIPARSTAESGDPQYFIPTGKATRLRTYLKYSGTVSSCSIQICYFVRGTWFRGPGVYDALTGANEVRDWGVRPGTIVGFRVSSLSGGGTVSVLVEDISGEDW